MEEKRKLLRVMAVSTLLFALALAGAIALSAAVERGRAGRIEEALRRGDTARAARLIGRMDEGEERTALELRCRFLEAEARLESGELREAAAAFAALGGYPGAEEAYCEALYRLAEQEFSSGDFDTAQRRFEALGAYRDAAERALHVRLGRVEALEAEGRIYDAFLLCEKLGDVLDARERSLALAERICGARDLDAARAVAQNLSTEELQHRAALRQRREALPQGIVDVGFYHTVARRDDGTVLACGDNRYGQCEVADWQRVRAVCAGAWHTVALFEDGTVAAVGRGSEGQCDTRSWRGITAIAASDWATFGLKEDGTVVCCGYGDYTMLENWPRAASITGGSYLLAALREDGTALLSHASARSEELVGLVGIAVNTGYAAGLREDGRVVCAAADLSAWRDVVALAASSNAILGLDAQGKVLAHFFRADTAIELGGLGEVVALAAGGTHCVFVLADGSVEARGENGSGECDTAGWKLF